MLNITNLCDHVLMAGKQAWTCWIPMHTKTKWGLRKGIPSFTV